MTRTAQSPVVLKGLESGRGSSLAAATLWELGASDLVDLSGGFRGRVMPGR
jgi:hypothetical protein